MDGFLAYVKIDALYIFWRAVFTHFGAQIEACAIQSALKKSQRTDERHFDVGIELNALFKIVGTRPFDRVPKMCAPLHGTHERFLTLKLAFGIRQSAQQMKRLVLQIA